jgi:large subunit ribosomal protein L21
MYAIVEIAGQQFKVEEGKKIFVQHLKTENGKSVEFDQVLLLEDNGKVTVGEPVIKDALVEGKVLEQLRGDKVIVFKKKRKKGYRVRNGHRQYFTKVEIVSIKEKAARKGQQKEEAVKAEVAAEEKPVITTASEKKPATKKAAAPKKVQAKEPEKSTVKSSAKSTVKKAAARTAKPENTKSKKPPTRKPAEGKAE